MASGVTAYLTKQSGGESDKEPEGRLKLNFSPSVLLQNFALPLPFRWKHKPKLDLSPPGKGAESSLAPQPPLVREVIELASFGGVVEIDSGGQGLGHRFLHPGPLRNPTWCDRCGDFIWGLDKLRDCVQCHYCRYTCHKTCQDLVTLDCKGIGDTQLTGDSLSDIWEDAQETLTPSKEETVYSKLLSHQLIGHDELVRKIEEYNTSNPNLQMVLEPAEEGESLKFTGLIRVHLNLTRPINVISGTRPPSIYDILKEEEDPEGHRTLTSFYLPFDTVKALHITSEFTCREVITALLKKFKVADHPHKFALYERCPEPLSGRARLRPLPDLEKPLVLALLWSGEDKQFVLQENDTGDIMWEGFALPELNNFLRMLDREEEESIRLVRAKYQLLHEKLQEALNAAKPS